MSNENQNMTETTDNAGNDRIMIAGVDMTEALKKDPLKWDELKDLYTEGMGMIHNGVIAIKNLLEENSDILAVNPIILEQIQGLNKEMIRIAGRLDVCKAMHTINDEMLTGQVALDNIDEQTKAISIIAAYQELIFTYRNVFEKASIDIFAKLGGIRAAMKQQQEGAPNA